MYGSILSVIRRFVFGLLGYHHYDYQAILERYGLAITQPMTDLHRFSLMLPYILLKAMHARAVSIMVLDSKTGQYQIHVADGEKCELDGKSVGADNPLVQELSVKGEEITFQEAEKFALKSISEGNKTKYRAIVSEMNKLGAVLSIPAVSKSPKFPRPTLLFGVNFGGLISGEDYTREDIDYLKRFIRQVAANLETAF